MRLLKWIKRRYADSPWGWSNSRATDSTAPIEPLSTDDIIRHDAKHAELRHEAIRAKFERRHHGAADA
jgi:hypothetical protein